ncbi:hypothetical protein ACIQCD_14245 [Streptomyces sp. NPDC093250]|uniref:hypothetical protein n=1 Tax=Streptomyces sp. NPDC093250 TaxID=3366036 RepID=UPI0037FAF551
MNGAGDAPEAPTACGGGVSPGSGGTGPPAEGAEGGEEGDGGVTPEDDEAEGPEEEDDVPESELPEAFCVYQAGGA